ncbi:pentatricopeptide repeat-containing protein At4g19191, mitochondrial-like [Nymphaea colorata]|uniref:Pentacotripeptide-repeat region of PRORP domain-containing protein n=1 Tax=Nymphaea colorata TaxID=210225 RepID=A0A5K1ASJ9_9MAGN|nr:pentatricopeptide repeat-containing protein At4g19191, mitochondrial-like [Nymphaea colorata]
MLSRWNALVQRYIKDGFYGETLNLYCTMLKSGRPPDNFTFPLVIKSCAQLGILNDGKKIHAHSIIMGLESDVFVQTALVDMYGKTGDLSFARKVFDKMPKRSIVSWNAMIDGYCKVGEFSVALGIFNSLLMGDLRPNLSSLVSITAGSGQCGFPEIGRSIHCHGMKLGHDLDSVLCNSIMKMYIALGLVDSARLVFNLMLERSVVSWTTLIGGYTKIGNFHQAFLLFSQMLLEGTRPDSVTFINLLPGCVGFGSVLVGSSLHASIIKSGCEHDDLAMTALVSMYMKFHDANSSRKLFEVRSDKSVFLWTSLITGYVQNGDPSEALVLFQKMLNSHTKPNEITISSALSAAAELGSLAMGKWIEEYIYTNKIKMSIRVATALINMYCKCGSIEDARGLFDRSPNRDLALWSSMIIGYAINGKGKEAIGLFSDMLKDGTRPDDMVVTGILTACCHSGSVTDGLHYFLSMKNDFNIEPKLVHYSCMIDLLSRAGYLDEAWKIIQEVPIDYQVALMAPFLSACKTHANVGLAEAARPLLEHQPSGCGSHVLLSNIYAAAGKWDMAESTRGLVQQKGLVKEAGCSKLEVDTVDHFFERRVI